MHITPFSISLHRTTALSLSIALLAVAGCSGDVAYVRKPLAYEQIPLSRPAAARTYSFTQQDVPAQTAQQVRIAGLEPVAANGDIRIAVVGGPVRIDTDPSVVGKEHAQYNAWFTLANGQTLDGTRQFKDLGYAEPVVQDPRLTCSWGASGSVSVPLTLRAESAAGATLLATDFGKTSAVSLGSPDGQPGVQWSVSVTKNGETASRSNARTEYVDALVVGRGVTPLRVMKDAAGSLERNRDRSPAVRRLLADWPAHAVAAAEQIAAGQRSEVASQLSYHFASGPQRLPIEFGVIEQDAAWAEIVARFDRLSPTNATDADALITQIGARGADPTSAVRVRAMVAYNQALCHLAVGRLAEAQKALTTAEQINSQERDGMFGSSGKQLAQRITGIRSHIADRQTRLAAAAKRGE